MKRPFDDLGATLAYLRRQAGLTQAALAERAGITKPMMSNYEREAGRPSLETIEKILAALGWDVEDLGRALKRVQRGHERQQRVVEGELDAEAARAAADREAQADEAIEGAKVEIARTLERVREQILNVEPGEGRGVGAERVRSRGEEER